MLSRVIQSHRKHAQLPFHLIRSPLPIPPGEVCLRPTLLNPGVLPQGLHWFFSLPPPRFCLSSPSPPLQPGQDPSPFELPTKGDRGVGQRILKVAVTGHCEETPTSPTTSNAPFQLPSYVQLTGVRLTLILGSQRHSSSPVCFLFQMELQSLNTSPPVPPPPVPGSRSLSPGIGHP